VSAYLRGHEHPKNAACQSTWVRWPLTTRGISLLVVEQNAYAAMSIADRGYVIETGSVVASGPARLLIEDPAVRSAYLGL